MNMIHPITGEQVCRFADIEVLRYAVDGFESLPLSRKLLIYHLSEAALAGRDITYDQFGRYNLRIRHILETIYQHDTEDVDDANWLPLVEYLRRLWFSSGIHHHYGGEKFIPGFSRAFVERAVRRLQQEQLLLLEYDVRELGEVLDEMFDPERSPKRTEQSGGKDLISASSVNYYDRSVRQHAVESYYAQRAKEASPTEQLRPLSYGLNSRVGMNDDGLLYEQPYHIGALYGTALETISAHLRTAKAYAETDEQRLALESLISYYKTGDLDAYNQFCIHWVADVVGEVDFINGFTEVYADPLGIKGSWEGIVHLRNHKASERTAKIAAEAAWFERHAPIDERFKKIEPKGISASVVTVAMLAGDCYPATPIGVNLPNADWIRAEYGSKSVTIDNILSAYKAASLRSGMDEVFVPNAEVRALLSKYDHLTDELHTDLHECLGHGSGQLLPGVSPEALGAYASVNEEARADLFALYYMADPKLIDMGLLPDARAYEACYYRYLLNGLITQLVRIKPGAQLEEAHMRNRALIARYALERGQSDGTVALEGTTLVIHDYKALRGYFADLLSEVQRVKSEGDAPACRRLVERYAIEIDPELHAEVLRKYEPLNLAPYRGFVNPRMTLVRENGEITDVSLDYTEGYDEQMLRYSRDYATLPLDPVAEERFRKPQPSEQTLALARELRTNLRQAMDGVVASSMRSKGLHYGLNFGLTMTHIHARARALPQSKDLASYLHSRDVRELKLIAQLVMPTEHLNFTEATYLGYAVGLNPELRDALAKHLFDRTPSAPSWALAWLVDSSRYADLKTLAYTVLARWFTQGYELESPRQLQALLRIALRELDDAAEYTTADQRAALLMLKRWARGRAEVQQQLLEHPVYRSWQQSSSCLKQEFVDDISFELSFR